MSHSKVPVVLSVEQALSMSYATLRFVHLGWRVIRLEPTPVPGRKSRGDPNRYIGREMAGKDLHSYFVAPNAGKEAIAVDLKHPEGQKLLRDLVRELPVDVFCTNTLPRRHTALGMDYDTLRRERGALIWCSISAMGLQQPGIPGYDPMIQALCGYMDITGHPDGPPLQCGPPIVDLKAGDEAFAQVLLAMLERERTGEGKQIDISMARAAVSWLHTFLPMLDMDSPPSELRRAGNQHRQFIPVNAYPSADGYIYVAIGSDAQWERFVAQPMFSSLALARYSSNEGRRAHSGELHEAIAAITSVHSAQEIFRVLESALVPHSPITPIERVAHLPFVRSSALATTAPDGRRIRLPPAAVDTPHLDATGGQLPFAPAYGQHTVAVLREMGMEESLVSQLLERRIIAG